MQFYQEWASRGFSRRPALSGCASLTPTYKTEAAYAVLDVKGVGQINRNAFLNDITKVIKTNMAEARIIRGIPAATPPAQPGRFTLVNPFGKSGLGALVAAGGVSMQIPSCDGALMTISSNDSSMRSSGEQTDIHLCVWEYSAGYHIDFYVKYTEATGGLSPELLGATLAKSLIGSSAQFIPRTINSVRTTASQYGKVTVVDSYIPESFKGVFQDAVASLSAN